MQAGQLVIIGGAEQLILECLLLADVGRRRQQQVAAADADRAVACQQHLPLLAVADAFLGDRFLSRLQQIEHVLAALIEQHRG